MNNVYNMRSDYGLDSGKTCVSANYAKCLQTLHNVSMYPQCLRTILGQTHVHSVSELCTMSTVYTLDYGFSIHDVHTFSQAPYTDMVFVYACSYVRVYAYTHIYVPISNQWTDHGEPSSQGTPPPPPGGGGPIVPKTPKKCL